MKKTTLLLFVFCCLTLLVFGQSDVDIVWGNEEKSNKYAEIKVLSVNETEVHILHENAKYPSKYKATFDVKVYNHDMKMVRSKNLPFENTDQKMKYINSIYMNGNIYIFSAQRDFKSLKSTLYVQQLDKNTLELNPTPRKIDEIKLKSKKHESNFKIRVSRDSSKVAVFAWSHINSESKVTINCSVFDANLATLWSKKITLPFKAGLSFLEDMKVDNNGKIHIIVKVFNDKKKDEVNGKPNYTYYLFSITNENELKDYNLEIEDYFLRDIAMTVNAQNDVICVGFYSEDNKIVSEGRYTGTHSVDGSYFIKIDSDSGKSIVQKIKAFDTELAKKYREKDEMKKIERKGKTRLAAYVIKDIVLREDGGAVIISEQDYTTEETNGGEDYHTNHIIVANFSPDGETEWITKIGKEQYVFNFANNQFSSYTIAAVDDKLHIIFNDDDKNLKYKLGEELSSFGGGAKATHLKLVTLDQDGNQTSKVLFSNDEMKLNTKPSSCAQIDKNSMVIFRFDGKKEVLGKISFN